MKALTSTLALILLTSASAVLATVPPSTTPPRIVMDGPGPNQESLLLKWTAGAATCAGVPQAMIEPPAPDLPLVWGGAAASVRPVDLSFAVDAIGRLHAIAGAEQGYVAFGDSLGAALAASRFPAGAPRRDCTIRFTPQAVPLAQVSAADAYAATILPAGIRSKQLLDRTKPADTTCFAPAPAVRMRAFPDFKAMKATPGRPHWSMVGFDIDKEGRPVRIRTLGGSGQSELDRGSREAVAQSRFEPGERRGCLYPYRLAPAVLPAPPVPDRAALRPSGSTCPDKISWQTQPALVFPEAYRRRRIEGWAAVTYDVAPWGETGNVRVLAAEPAAEFGDRAAAIVKASKQAEQPKGYIGCTQIVRFAIGDKADRPDRRSDEDGE